MFGLTRASCKNLLALLVGAAFLVFMETSYGQTMQPAPGGGGGGTAPPTGAGGVGFAGLGSGNKGLTRASGMIMNPVNFSQYAQVTGVKPITGTVTIYNQFGQLAMMGSPFMGGGVGFGGGLGFGGAFGGGVPGGLGGFGGGGNTGSTSGGDDPPQGVLLHVNYANMFLPNMQQLQQANQPGFGGFGGLGGFGNPFGFGGGFGTPWGGGKFGGFNGGYGL
jgi:hypothetical protein